MVNSGLEREGEIERGRETMQCQAPAPPQRTQLRREAGTQGKTALYGQDVPLQRRVHWCR